METTTLYNPQTDYIWGVFIAYEDAEWFANNKFCYFWGKRGKKLTYKVRNEYYFQMTDRVKKKMRPSKGGYTNMPLDMAIPFNAELDKVKVWCALKGHTSA